MRTLNSICHHQANNEEQIILNTIYKLQPMSTLNMSQQTVLIQ